MGCRQSKRRTHARVSEYQMIADSEGKGLKRRPTPLDTDLCTGNITMMRFHNLFYDGFYAPFIKNPFYMLILDTREESAFNEKHIITARWYGNVTFSEKNFDWVKYGIIVLYDEDGTGIKDPNSRFRNLYDNLKTRRFEPQCLIGGIEAVQEHCGYMLTRNQFPMREKSITINWYPLMILEHKLYLGRADQALNPTILRNLEITHIVCLTDTIPIGIFPSISYLICPLTDSSTTELLDKLGTILKFMKEAFQEKGRILVHCDQGVNRSPVVVMAYLIEALACTLEDAFFYIKQLRRVLLPEMFYLEQLSAFEEKVFGRPITETEDLWC